MKFMTGGDRADPSSPRADKADLVKFQNRRYSPDGRSCICFLRSECIFSGRFYFIYYYSEGR